MDLHNLANQLKEYDRALHPKDFTNKQSYFGPDTKEEIVELYVLLFIGTYGTLPQAGNHRLMVLKVHQLISRVNTLGEFLDEIWPGHPPLGVN